MLETKHWDSCPIYLLHLVRPLSYTYLQPDPVCSTQRQSAAACAVMNKRHDNSYHEVITSSRGRALYK